MRRITKLLPFIYQCKEFFLFLLRAALLATASLACFVDIENAPCISSSNCPQGQYCRSSDKRCHKTEFTVYSCEETDCEENEFCYKSDMTCHLKDEVGLSCNNYFDCPSGQICIDGLCDIPAEPQCKENSECIKDKVDTAICEEAVCKITSCQTGYKDNDFDYKNGCEAILPCDPKGYKEYEQCIGDNVCKCDANCIILAGFYGINYDKGLCLKRCAPTDANKSFGNMLCSCTIQEMGICKQANLFETAMLSGNIRAKLVPDCDNFMKDSALFSEISFSIGGKTSYYNRGVACKKRDNNRDIIQVILYKMCNILPCKDIISISLPQNITSNQTLGSEEAGALKASVIYDMVNNNVVITEIQFNAISVKGEIVVKENGSSTNRIIELNLNLKMLRYDIPVCGEIVQKDCSTL